MKYRFRIIAAIFMCFCLALSSCGLDPDTGESTGSRSETIPEVTPESRSAAETEKEIVTLPPTAESGSQDETEQDTESSEESREAAPETTVDPMTLVTCFMYSMASSLNVRSGESTDHSVIGNFTENAEIPVIEILESGWVKVVCEGMIGYVSGDYVTEDKDWKEKLQAEYRFGYQNGEAVTLDPSWTNAGFSEIHTGAAVMYRAAANRKNIVVGVNAGHGCSGGGNYQTYSHPDMTAKITGGTNAAGAVKSMAISSGMTFSDGTAESTVNLQVAMLLRDLLLAEGFDVLMIRDGADVQLDNVARTVICNNAADCHIAIHFDGDGLSYDKGCYFMSVPDGLKYMDPVSYTWEKSEALGRCLVQGLGDAGNAVYDYSGIDQDLTQTSYSSVPSVDVELGNQSSDHSDAKIQMLAAGLLAGVKAYFGY